MREPMSGGSVLSLGGSSGTLRSCDRTWGIRRSCTCARTLHVHDMSAMAAHLPDRSFANHAAESVSLEHTSGLTTARSTQFEISSGRPNLFTEVMFAARAGASCSRGLDTSWNTAPDSGFMKVPKYSRLSQMLYTPEVLPTIPRHYRR